MDFSAGRPVRRCAVGKGRVERIARNRLAIEKALSLRTPQREQCLGLRQCFHAFRDDAEAQRRRHADNRAHDRRRAGILIEAADEPAVDLDCVEFELLQVDQVEIGRASCRERVLRLV